MRKPLLFIATAFIANAVIAQSWLLTGNSGTNVSTNFIGTTDSKPLTFRVNNLQAGYIDFASGKANTMFGYQALRSNTGNNNLALGYKASYSNTTGKNNMAAGAYALYFNTTGYSNIAIGIGALYRNTTVPNLVAVGDSVLYNNASGGGNTGIGSKVLYTNTSGNSNTAGGFYALHNNSTGSFNSAWGVSALTANTSGSYNSALGLAALGQNTTGNYNTASGYQSLYFNSTGTQNTAMGYQALYFNKANLNTAVGYQAMYTNSTGSFNTTMGTFSMYNTTTGYSSAAFGYSALYGNTTGYYNAAMGPLALFSNSTGYENTASGYRALYSNTTGATNTASGWEALYNNINGYGNTATGTSALASITTGSFNTSIGNIALAGLFVGSYNTAIGNASGPFIITEMYNSTAVGDEAEPSVDNQVRIGNGSVSSIGGAVGWTNYSDERIKTDIRENVPGLSFINLLKPVTYHFKLAKENELMGKRKDTVNWRSKYDIEKMNFTGLLAQEVQKAEKQINYNFSGVDTAGKVWGLRYAEFVMPLIKSVQELSKMNDQKDAEIAQQGAQINDLQKQINDLKALLLPGKTDITTADPLLTNSAVASLAQNVPNPFASSTSINYNLPKQFSSARIMITDKAGNTVKQFSISGAGKGNITVDAAMLSSGTYQYSLYVDGKLLASKQMLLGK